jgi:glycosyltransferase involved in cell wall biosynthesis
MPGYIRRDALTNYYLQADIFVLPSLSESFGQVLLEAMSTGLPIVATTVGGIPEIVHPDRGGVLIPPATLGQSSKLSAIVNGRMLAEKARGNMIRMPKGKLAVIEGLEDYIIVDKKEVLLIFPKSKEQDIKEVLQKVKEKFGDQYS